MSYDLLYHSTALVLCTNYHQINIKKYENDKAIQSCYSMFYDINNSIIWTKYQPFQKDKDWQISLDG